MLFPSAVPISWLSAFEMEWLASTDASKVGPASKPRMSLDRSIFAEAPRVTVPVVPDS